MAETFEKSWAVVVGIDKYGNGISPLTSAVNDACSVAEVLSRSHGYTVRTVLDEEGTLAGLSDLFNKQLPGEVGPKDRVLVYFAGHGVALDGDKGPEGYVVPQDAAIDDPFTLLSMAQFSEALTALPCRHFLLVLDCCFAGAFRWTSTRGMRPAARQLYKQRFDRFMRDPAWQVLTSAGSQQRASDVERRFGRRAANGAPDGAPGGGAHSPFAAALIEGLGGGADLPVAVVPGFPPKGDGVITASELYVYLRNKVEAPSDEGGQPQTPGLWPLPKHGEGEYVFLVPGVTPELPDAPELSPANNPYRGLQSYSAADRDLFFGRGEVVKRLMELVPTLPLTVVAGASGSGKSSVVKAGVLPRLGDEEGWTVFDPVRPTRTPLQSLAGLFGQPVGNFSLKDAVAGWLTQHPSEHLVVMIDQFEELITLSTEADREATLSEIAGATGPDTAGASPRFHLVLTVRADFEPHFAAGILAAPWKAGRFVVPPMSQDELREAILGPAEVKVVYFDPPALVDRIINEVVQMPGALPLLSFTLSELYLSYVKRGGSDRLLTEADYDELGGVAGALRVRANAEYDTLKGLDPAPDLAQPAPSVHPRRARWRGRAPAEAADGATPHQRTMRRILLRMVSLSGGELARRRVDAGELDYATEGEDARVKAVVERLDAARLIVSGTDPLEGPYVEPAHDALIQGWDRLWKWVQEEQEALLLRQRLTPAAEDWARNSRKAGQLWTSDPRLKQVEAARVKPDTWLNQVEAEFSETSERRRKRNQRALIISLSAAMLIFAVLALIALNQTGVAQENAATAVAREYARATQQVIAEDNARTAVANGNARATQEALAKSNAATAVAESKVANSRSLASQSGLQLSKQLDLALLLAVQSYRTQDTEESRSSLLDATEYSPELQVIRYTPDVFASAYPTNGETWVSACVDAGCDQGEAVLWKITNGVPVSSTLPALTDIVDLAALSADGRTLAVLSGPDVSVYDLQQPGLAGRRIATVDEQASVHIALDGTGKTLAIAEDSPGNPTAITVTLQATNGAPEGSPIVLTIPDRVVLTDAVALSPDARRFAVGGCIDFGANDCLEGGAVAWDLTAKPPRQVITASLGRDSVATVSSVAFSPDGTTLAYGSIEGEVATMSDAGDKAEHLAAGESAASRRVTALAFNNDAKQLSAANAEQIALIDLAGQYEALDARRPEPVADLDPATFAGAVLPDMAIAEGGNDVVWIACAAANGKPCGAYRVLRGDIASGGKNNKVLQTLPAVGSPSLVALSRDGTGLAVLDGRKLTAFDLGPATPVSRTVQLDADVAQGYDWPLLAVGPHAALLAVGRDDGTIALIDTATGKSRASAPPRYKEGVQALAFSSDGKTLASAGAQNLQSTDIRVWDLARGVSRTIRGNTTDQRQAIRSLAVDDAARLVAASYPTNGPDEIRVYNFGSGRMIGVPQDNVPGAFTDKLPNIAFDGTGTRLMTPGGQVQAISPAQWLTIACSIANRNLTQDEWSQYVSAGDYCKACPDLPPGSGAPQNAPACSAPHG